MCREIACRFITLLVRPVLLSAVCLLLLRSGFTLAYESHLAQPDLSLTEQANPIVQVSARSPEPDQQLNRSPRKLRSNPLFAQPIPSNQGPIVSVSEQTVDFYGQPVVRFMEAESTSQTGPVTPIGSIRQVAGTASTQDSSRPRPVFDEGETSALTPTTLPQLGHQPIRQPSIVQQPIAQQQTASPRIAQPPTVQQPTPLPLSNEGVGVGTAQSTSTSPTSTSVLSSSSSTSRSTISRETSKTDSTTNSTSELQNPQEDEVVQPLKPTADPHNVSDADLEPVHLQSAAFLGIRPGKSTVEDVAQKLGAPQKVTQLGQKTAQLYSIDEMSHVEVLMNDDVVESIEVVFGDAYPVEQVRETFASELKKIRPVSFADEKGDVIGLMFPEKGVTLVYAPSQEPGVPSQMVQKLVILPILAEPFIIRARGYQDESPSETITDLKWALSFSPNNPEVFWLLAQIELQVGDVYDALKHCERAIELNQSQLQYHITLAKVLIALNQYEEAQQYLEELLPLCDRFLHHKAVVYCLLGEVIRDRTKNCEKAYEHHKASLDLAVQLREHPNQTIQAIARELLINTQLGIIEDIAQGNWENKDVAIDKWLLSVKEMLKDPQIASKKRLIREYAFRIAIAQLTVQAPNLESLTLEQTIQESILTAQELINVADDPLCVRKTQWDLGLALFETVQVFQRKKQYLLALKYGEATVDLMEQGIEGRTGEWDYYALARLYLRIGAVHATGMKNYKAAVVWFDRARPLFEDIANQLGTEESGKIGEMLVLMGVSYWETDQQKEAVRLSEEGLVKIQQAVDQGLLDSRKLLAPCMNLETMYGKLDQKDKAAIYTQKAALLRESLSAASPNQLR
ncbi:MAG: CDC27 family protein [Thermoguttaceae bacterium]